MMIVYYVLKSILPMVVGPAKFSQTGRGDQRAPGGGTTNRGLHRSHYITLYYITDYITDNLSWWLQQTKSISLAVDRGGSMFI